MQNNFYSSEYTAYQLVNFTYFYSIFRTKLALKIVIKPTKMVKIIINDFKQLNMHEYLIWGFIDGLLEQNTQTILTDSQNVGFSKFSEIGPSIMSQFP